MKEYNAIIEAGSREEYDRLKARVQVLEENSFDLGEDDSGAQFPKMKFAAFAKMFEVLDVAAEVRAEIAKACYSTYLNGYKGGAFCNHITLKLREAAK